MTIGIEQQKNFERFMGYLVGTIFMAMAAVLFAKQEQKLFVWIPICLFAWVCGFYKSVTGDLNPIRWMSVDYWRSVSYRDENDLMV